MRHPASGDPRLKTYSWAKIKAHWRRVQGPCARCGQPIDYDGPYRIPVGRGRYRLNPAALHVGHITARALDGRTEWRIEETQPEHVRCSTQAGARLGNALRGARRRLDTSRAW